jgi:hypothetical protein
MARRERGFACPEYRIGCLAVAVFIGFLSARFPRFGWVGAPIAVGGVAAVGGLLSLILYVSERRRRRR